MKVPEWKTQKNPEWWTEYLISLGIDPKNPWMIFLDHIANHQYQKMHDRVEVKECKNTKLKDKDSTFEIDIDYIIDWIEDELWPNNGGLYYNP